jgi:hypothetical protein
MDDTTAEEPHLDEFRSPYSSELRLRDGGDKTALTRRIPAEER